MNIEKTMEFILDMHVKPEERFTTSERRMERMVAQNSRLVARLARAGLTLRSDVRRHERATTRIEENLAEATDKLNVLIHIVDKSENGKRKRRKDWGEATNSKPERTRAWQSSTSNSTR